MLDRLSLGLVSLPADTYDEVVILADADGIRRSRLDHLAEGEKEGKMLGTIVSALKEGGKLSVQEGNATGGEIQRGIVSAEEEQAAVLAGLYKDPKTGGIRRMKMEEIASVPLRRSAPAKAIPRQEPSMQQQQQQQNGGLNPSEKRKLGGLAGVGFSDDPGEVGGLDGEEEDEEDDSDEDLIDENELLSEEDKTRPIAQRKS